MSQPHDEPRPSAPDDASWDEADYADILELVRAQPHDAWAGGPPVAVDVERALAQVLRAESAALRRHRRWGRGLRVGSTVAAAAVLLSLAAPVILRLRIEAAPTARAQTWSPGVRHHAVFWTSGSY